MAVKMFSNFSISVYQTFDQVFGASTRLGRLANLTQKSMLNVECFFPEYNEYATPILRGVSIIKTHFAPGIAIRHLINRTLELPALGRSYKKWRNGGKISEFLFGASKSNLVKKYTYAVDPSDPSKDITVTDCANENQSVAAYVSGCAKLMQKVCDTAGNFIYWKMPSRLTFENEKLQYIKDLKSDFQVVEYSIGLGWDSYNLGRKLWNKYYHKQSETGMAKSFFAFAGNLTACHAASWAAYRFHFMDKKTRATEVANAIICASALTAALVPYIADWYAGPKGERTAYPVST